MFSDVVLAVEDKKFHVHRFVLAMWSPVFKKMFSSDFKEKNSDEIPLPDEKASEFQELLLIIHPTASQTEWNTVTNENCYFLLKFADKYQMDTVKQMSEDLLVEKVKSTSGNTFLDELRFAQSYKQDKLIEAIVHRAVYGLRLDDFKSHDVYKDDEIEPHIYKQIVEGKIKNYEVNWNAQYGMGTYRIV